MDIFYKMSELCIFGLGYVGKEVATLASKRGYEISVVDADENVVSAVKNGGTLEEVDITEATTDGRSVVDRAEIIISAVPTPLDSSYGVDLSAIESVTEIISTVDSDNQPLYIVESTIPPGTIQDFVSPILSENGLKVGEDIYVAHVPERINPGTAGWSLENIPRVAGAVTDAGLTRVVSFYEELLEASVHTVDSPSIAEASKLVENTYRDINIAYVNEVALALEELKIDTKAVLDAADTKPFGFTRFSPGAGVGGHCIPIDPYFLIEKAGRNGFNNRFLKYAREVNDHMPKYLAEKTIEELNAEKILPNGSRVLLLGKSFKPNVNDVRNSPYFEIKAELERYGVHTETYDPNISEGSTVDSPYCDVDAVVLITAHDEFQSLSFERLSNNGVRIFIDGRNIFDPERVGSYKIRYIGVGR